MRLYSIDCDTFAQIDTEAKAYCFGFLAADGWLQTGDKGFGVAVKDVDVPVLEYIRSTCKSTAPFTIKSRSSGYATGGALTALYVSSRKLTADLISHGLHRRKGVDGMRLPEVSSDLMRHMIRGVFDGDGSIGERQFWLTGSQMLCEQIQNVASSHGASLSFSITNNYPRLNGSRKSAEFMDWLYEGCEFALPRKLARYVEFWKYPRTRGKKSVPIPA